MDVTGSADLQSAPEHRSSCMEITIAGADCKSALVRLADTSPLRYSRRQAKKIGRPPE